MFQVPKLPPDRVHAEGGSCKMQMLTGRKTKGFSQGIVGI